MRENHIYFDDYFRTWGGEDNEFGIQLEIAGAHFIVGRNAKAIHYPAKVRSYDKLHNDKAFHDNHKNIARKYPNNKTVQIWAERGDRAANNEIPNQ